MIFYYMTCRVCGHRQLNTDYEALGACTACGRNPVTPEGDEKYEKAKANYATEPDDSLDMFDETPSATPTPREP
jgi:ribosomal protein L37E